MDSISGYVICSDVSLLKGFCKKYGFSYSTTIEDDRFILTLDKDLERKDTLDKLADICSEYSLVHSHNAGYVIYRYINNVLDVIPTFTVSAEELTETLNKYYDINFTVYEIEDALVNCDVQIN